MERDPLHFPASHCFQTAGDGPSTWFPLEEGRASHEQSNSHQGFSPKAPSELSSVESRVPGSVASGGGDASGGEVTWTHWGTSVYGAPGFL